MRCRHSIPVCNSTGFPKQYVLLLDYLSQTSLECLEIHPIVPSPPPLFLSSDFAVKIFIIMLVFFLTMSRFIKSWIFSTDQLHLLRYYKTIQHKWNKDVTITIQYKFIVPYCMFSCVVSCCSPETVTAHQLVALVPALAVTCKPLWKFTSWNIECLHKAQWNLLYVDF